MSRGVPASATSALRALARVAQPPSPSRALDWLRTQAQASTLADLGRQYLPPAEADTIERLLRAGRHGAAAHHFCEQFSHRCFPLDYGWGASDHERFLLDVTRGIEHEGYGDSWEEYGDLWSLRPIFLLSWALMEDPYGSLRDEFIQDEVGDEEEAASADRLCDQARAATAQLAELPVTVLFAHVPPDGFPIGHLRPRLDGTPWKPLLWAAPWLWRLSGNRFLDQYDGEGGQRDPWSLSTVFALAAEYRQALRVMRAIDAFDAWLTQAPTERTQAAVRAALGPPSGRLASLLDLPLADHHAVSAYPAVAAAS